MEFLVPGFGLCIFPNVFRQPGIFLRGKVAIQARRPVLGDQRRLDGDRAAAAEGIPHEILAPVLGQHHHGCRQSLPQGRIVANCPIENNIPVIQLERKVAEISDMVQAQLTPVFENDFGVNLKRFDISAIEIDKESENYSELTRLTKEQQLRRVEIDTEQHERISKLSAESQFIQAHAINKQTEVLKEAAHSMGEMGSINLGGDGINPAGMMIGMTMGGAMGNQFAGMMNQCSQLAKTQQSPVAGMTPPPPPNAAQYTVAINGQQYGPYNIQQMQQLANTGQINSQTLVWVPGMTQWAAASTLPDLAQLFISTPPPMPQTPPTI